MKSHREYLTFSTPKRRDYINITREVEAALDLIADIDEWLDSLAPFGKDYRHHRTGEDNGDAHLKNLLLHHQVMLGVTDGAIDFGPWQQVYYAEFDGRRRKRVLIKIIGD